MSAGVVYRFEGGELDGARHRLSVGGQAVELEPKAFAVLEDLLAHAGSMRSRDELLDAVWGHRHVTPAVLNRCIGQVRKALGDHAESPRYVQTVHTLGYRFIAPVEAIAVTSDATGKATASSAAVATPAPSRKRAWGIAAGVVALALIGGLAWRSRDGASAPGELVARAPTQVVLVPFEIPANAADMEPQVRALESSILQRLRMLPGLRVERGTSRDDAIVLTAVVEGGNGQRQLRIRMRNVDAPFERRYPLQLAKLFDTTMTVQRDVVTALRPDSAAALEPSGVLIDAEQSVRSGVRARAGLTLQDQRDAIAHFRRAIEIDPTNADAWCFLGGLYLEPAFNALESKDTAFPPAQEAITRGLRLDPASAHCHAKMGDLLRLQNRHDEAEAAFRRSLAIEPTLYAPRAALAVIEFDRGHYTRWRDELERLVREHPERGWLHCMLMNAYATTGHPDEARAMEPIVYRHHPELRNVNWVSGAIDFNYHHPARGIQRYREVFSHDPDDRSYPLSIALVAETIGDPATAKKALDEAGYLDTPDYLLAHTWLFFALDDPRGAVAWLRDAKVSPSLGLMQRALLAQGLALDGHRGAAIAEYARVYEGGWRDKDPAWADKQLEATQLLNYASLLDPGPLREDLVSGAARHLATFRANGLAMPWTHYQAAQIAVMRGDRARAMTELDRAIDAGWTDALAFSRDLPWRTLTDDPAFAQRKARLEKIAGEQRRILAGDAKPAGTVVAR